MKQNFFTLDIEVAQIKEDPNLKETQKMKTLKAQTICF